MQEFLPRLTILPASQRRLWTELVAVPHEFVLYGGTALALHLGHRSSVDFDFFGSRALERPALETGISFLAGAKVIQRDTNPLSLIVDRGGGVKVSFFGVPDLRRLGLAGTKASVVQLRAEAKDYIDIDALITLGGIGLPTALAAAQELYGPSFNPQITLKALSYFGDGNLLDLPDSIQRRLVTAAREVDLDHLPAIASTSEREVRDHGFEP
jgi:hypothetical protein